MSTPKPESLIKIIKNKSKSLEDYTFIIRALESHFLFSNLTKVELLQTNFSFLNVLL